MVAKEKHRWVREPSSPPSKRVSFDMEKLSRLEKSAPINPKVNNTSEPTNDEETSRSVRFNDHPSIHDHIQKVDYSAAEKQSSFWTAADLGAMRKEMRELVQQFDMGILDIEEELEAIVIERYTKKETIQRKRRRKGTVRSLLNHQKSFEGELSERWLTNVYILESTKSQESAYLRAVSNEQQRLVAPPPQQEIVRHTETTPGDGKPLDLVNETRYWSSIFFEVVDYCTSK